MPATFLTTNEKNMNNLYGNDPLLGLKQPSLPELEKAQEEALQRLQQMKQASRQQVQTQSPTWDEIDNIMGGLSDRELGYIANNQEFQESNSVVMGILQREYLRIMRPIVEGTKDGKDALEKHLTLVKRLKKSAADETNKKYSLMDEYMENYSDMSFNDFLKIKKGKKKG